MCCVYPIFLGFFFWAFGFGLGFVLGLFFFCFPHEHSMKESLILYKNENCTTVRWWRSVQLFSCRKKEKRTHTHTHIHSTSAWSRMNTQSFPRSLALYSHTRANKKKSSASSFRRSGTQTAAKVTKSLNVKTRWKVTWSVTCHWTVFLLECAISHQMVKTCF